MGGALAPIERARLGVRHGPITFGPTSRERLTSVSIRTRGSIDLRLVSECCRRDRCGHDDGDDRESMETVGERSRGAKAGDMELGRVAAARGSDPQLQGNVRVCRRNNGAIQANARVRAYHPHQVTRRMQCASLVISPFPPSPPRWRSWATVISIETRLQSVSMPVARRLTC